MAKYNVTNVYGGCRHYSAQLKKLMFGEDFYNEEQVQLIAEAAQEAYEWFITIWDPCWLYDLYEGPQQYNNVHAKWEQTQTYYIHTPKNDWAMVKYDKDFAVFNHAEPDEDYEIVPWKRRYVVELAYLLTEAYRVVTDGDVE